MHGRTCRSRLEGARLPAQRNPAAARLAGPMPAGFTVTRAQVQAAILHRLGRVRRADRVHPFQIGDGGVAPAEVHGVAVVAAWTSNSAWTRPRSRIITLLGFGPWESGERRRN